jgi:hypothetical protein
MTKQYFSFEEIFKFGWAKSKQHAWFIFLTFIISSLVINASANLPFISVLVIFMATLSIVSLSLAMVRDHHFSFADLYTPLLSQRRVLKFIVLATLYIFPLMVVLFSYELIRQGIVNSRSGLFAFGLILSIPAGVLSVFTTVRFKFFPFIVAEHEGATISSLIRTSYAFTEGRFVQVVLFLAIIALLNLTPVIVAFAFGGIFLLGFFVTAPVSILATAHLYNRIKDNTI